MVMVRTPRCGVPVRQDGTDVKPRGIIVGSFPSPALGDGDSAARYPYRLFVNRTIPI